jgi:predicted flap endonuclease-1-like 5' DNA nuclease
MLWLIGQISIFIVIAALVGAVAGWLLRGLWPSGRSRARESELQTALERATARIADLEAGLRAKRAAANAAAEQEQAATRRAHALQEEIDALRDRVGAETETQRRLQAEVEATVTAATAIRERLAALEAQAAAAAAPAPAPDPTISAGAGAASIPIRPQPPAASPSDPGPASSLQPGLFDGAAAPAPDEPPLPVATPEEEAALLEEERLAAMEEAWRRFGVGGEPGPADNLKRIRGIGPALEVLLNQMGIFRYDQIAGFTAGDIALVSAALGRAFPDRITRDDWVGSARTLLEARDSEEEGA